MIKPLCPEDIRCHLQFCLVIIIIPAGLPVRKDQGIVRHSPNQVHLDRDPDIPDAEMIELLVSQDFPAQVIRPLSEEGLKASLSILLDIVKERIRDRLAIVVFREGLAADIFVEQDFLRESFQGLIQVHCLLLTVELNLLIDNIVDELALDDELGCEVLEPPDFFGINHTIGFDIGGDIFEIVLALAPVPDPVFCEGPGIDLKKERIEIWHYE
jgi:hypothetical protein